MKNLIFTLCCVALLAGCQPAHAGTSIDMRNTDGTIDPIQGVEGQVVTALDSAEDEVNSVDRVEQQFSYQTPVAVDTSVKAAPGYVHVLKCSPTDNASVAGTIQLRDATSAGAGTVVEEWTVLAIDYTTRVPITFPVNKIFTTGIYLDFTTTTDIKCDVSFR